ncbi:hypothetical protein HFP72_01865 [Nocardiopsis sp. ARC36]
MTVDGRVIAYPTEMQSYVVFANRGMLEDAGVDIPTGETTAWEDLREIALAATTPDAHGLGWGLSSPTAVFMAMAPAFGGPTSRAPAPTPPWRSGRGKWPCPNSSTPWPTRTGRSCRSRSPSRARRRSRPSTRATSP